MRQANRRTGTLGVACLGLLGCSGMTGLLTALYAHASRPADPPPAVIVAQRFPSSLVEATQVAYSAVTAAPDEERELFAPHPFFPLAAAEPDAAPAPSSQEESAAPDGRPAAVKSSASKPAAAKAETAQSAVPDPARANPVHRHVANRPEGVLNDAQIASIKARLRLTPDQERMWPAVETALRKIVYSRNAQARINAMRPGSDAMAYIDPNSDEVRQLKYAALPLIMQLNDDQRREVKMMAHVMGLESVAAQF